MKKVYTTPKTSLTFSLLPSPGKYFRIGGPWVFYDPHSSSGRRPWLGASFSGFPYWLFNVGHLPNLSEPHFSHLQLEQVCPNGSGILCCVTTSSHLSLSDPKCVLRIPFRENQLPRFPPSKMKNGGSPLPLLWLTYVFTEPNGFALNQNIPSHAFPEKIVYTVECSLDRLHSKNTNHTLNFKSIAKLIIFSTRAKENFPFLAIYSEAVYQNDKETILEQIGPHKIDVCWRLCSDFDVLQGKAIASVGGPGQVQGELEGSISWASH